MFDRTNRYITKGIQEIPFELQLFMWNCIDILKEQGQELDFLQVFELSKERADDVFFQRVEHRQQIPDYKKTYRIFPAVMVDAKIFVLDDETHSTMLLAEEY